RRRERVARVRPVMLLLRETDVRALLSMEALIPLMEEALRAYSTGGVAQPVRLAMVVEPHAGYLGLMPAHLRAGRPGPGPRIPETMGAKAVTFYPRNAARDLPTHLAVVPLWDSATGELLAMMDGLRVSRGGRPRGGGHCDGDVGVGAGLARGVARRRRAYQCGGRPAPGLARTRHGGGPPGARVRGLARRRAPRIRRSAAADPGGRDWTGAHRGRDRGGAGRDYGRADERA